MEKHPYDALIETVADKMKEHEEDNLGFGTVTRNLMGCQWLERLL